MHLPRLLLAASTAAALAVPLAAAAPRTISFISVTVSDKTKGPTDTTLDNDFSGGKKIGHDTVMCDTSTGDCSVDFVFADGTISAYFGATGARGAGTISSGTGAYKGARGTFTYRITDATGARTAITLRLK